MFYCLSSYNNNFSNFRSYREAFNYFYVNADGALGLLM